VDFIHAVERRIDATVSIDKKNTSLKMVVTWMGISMHLDDQGLVHKLIYYNTNNTTTREEDEEKEDDDAIIVTLRPLKNVTPTLIKGHVFS
jgi:hypothetical protein